MDLSLAGCRALVTAASRGLGMACAASLTDEGAGVVICSRDASRAAAAAEQIGALAGIACDLGNAHDVESAIADVVARLGGLDILVVNCGPPPALPFFDAEDTSWGVAYTGVVLSAVRLLRAAAPHLRASGRGRVVILSGYGIREPSSNLVISESMRAAVAVTAKVLADELAGSGVTVNTIATGPVLTDRLRELQGTAAEAAGIDLDAQLARFAERIPIGRVGEPREIGDLCTYLCSKQAGFVTGQVIVADGGINRGV